MRVSHIFKALLALCITTCSGCSNWSDTSSKKKPIYSTPKAILASRIKDLDEFQETVQINYGLKDKIPFVELIYNSNHGTVKSYLQSGISEQDILDIRKDSITQQALFVLDNPDVIRDRDYLSEIYFLARKSDYILGEGDVAFYYIAEETVNKISDPELAYIVRKDSSEKGFINTINHITAQSFITSIYSEQIADRIADMHELKHMPELCTGDFSEAQLADTLNYPLDNYIDMINNEIGQELGARINVKLGIDVNTKWTPKLLANYLTELIKYYSWSFGIGMNPFSEEDEIVIRFADKINKIKNGGYEHL